MRHKNSGGFTIVEVILFLALASLLIITAMTSIGTRTKDVQFTDGMRSLETYFQREYSNIINGSISAQRGCRWNGSGYNFTNDPNDSDGSCIFLGVIFRFSDPGTYAPSATERGQLTAYQVVGRRLQTNDLLSCSDYSLYCIQPELSGVSSTHSFSWGVEMYGGGNPNGGSITESNAFGYMRLPDSTNVVSMVFFNYDPSTDPLSQELFNKDSVVSVLNAGTRESAIDDEIDAHYCFESATQDRFASVSLSPKLQGSGMTLAFSTSEDYNNNCENSAYDVQR